MPLSEIQSSLNAGELSPNLYARVDQAKFESGAALLRNFFVNFQGGVSNRAGTEFIAECKDVAGIKRLIPFTVSTEAAYVLEFGEQYIRAYSAGELVAEVATPYSASALQQLKYTQSADVLTLVHPSYQPANLSRTSLTTFSYDLIETGPVEQPPTITTMTAPHSGPYSFGYLVTAVDLDGKEESLASNPGVKHSEAMNETTNRVIGLTWTAPVTPVSAYNVYKWGPIDAVTLNPATVWGFIGTSQTTTFTDNNIAPDFSKQPPGWGDPFSGGQFQSITVNAPGSGYDGVGGDWPNIPYVPLNITGDGTDAAGFAVIDHALGTIVGVYLTNPGKNYTTATITANGEGGTGATFNFTFSDSDPLYPACTAYVQQRRGFAGSNPKPETLVLSQIGLYNNFNTTPISLDTDAIVLSISGEQVNTIKAMTPVSYGLLLFTTGGVSLLNGGSPYAPITPQTVTVQAQSAVGANDLIPLRVNADILYAQNLGNRIRNLSFAWQKQAYQGSDISALAAHLFDGFTIPEWAWAEEPFKIVWAVRDDGTMLSLTYVPDQDVAAWCRHDTQGLFKSVCAIPEGGTHAVYVIVDRHIPNEGGVPCWHSYIERMAPRQTCCIYDAWFVDSGLSLAKSFPTAPLYIVGGHEVGDTVDLYSYDPCGEPSGGFGVSGFAMEAIENWDAPQAAEFAADVFPFEGHASQMLLGRGYNPVRRKIMYILTDAPTETAVNDKGFVLWDGGDSIAVDATYDKTVWLNFSLAEIDIDSLTVTRYDAYDPASTVPNGIGGSDGTWRRTMAAFADAEQAPIISDPRTGNVFLHTDAGCQIYSLRLSEDFKLTISPFIGTVGDHFEMFGITDDWMLIGDQGKDGLNKYTLECIPRLRTSDEVAADYLLSYASFVFPFFLTIGSNVVTFGSCLSGDGKLYVFTLSSGGDGWSWNLYEWTPPTSAPFGGPVVGGGWADVTPWAAATGPNTLGSAYFRQNTDNTAHIPIYLHGSDVVVLLNCYYDEGDYFVWHFQCTYYRPSDAAWDFQGDFITGLMTADWQMTTDLGEAAWAFDQFSPASSPLGTGIRPLDTYRDYNSFDYGDDDSRRWFYFDVVPVVDGTPVDSDHHGILAQYQFAFGVAPALVRVIDTESWDVLYPAYTTAIGDPNAVEASMPRTAFDSNGIMTKDIGLSDPATSSWWFCGQNDNFFQFNSTFTNRLEGGVSAPFLRLTSTVPPSIGQCVHVGCGEISLTEVADNQHMVGEIMAPVNDLLVPGDPDGTYKPIDAGDWNITSPSNTLTLAHLKGKTVNALADGVVYEGLVADPTTGVVTLPDDIEACNFVAGLAYSSQIKTLYLTMDDLQPGSIQGKRKLIPAVTLRVDCTKGLLAGQDFDNLTEVPDLNEPDLAPKTLFLGDARAVIGAAWDEKGEVCVQQNLPLPATVLGIIVEVAPGDTGR